MIQSSLSLQAKRLADFPPQRVSIFPGEFMSAYLKGVPKNETIEATPIEAYGPEKYVREKKEEKKGK